MLLCETSQQVTQLVFNEGTISTTFELKIWVCVYDPFDLERVAREIIEQATGGKPPNVGGWEPLHHRLCNSVKGKRFLLVLDDVWTKDANRWELLKLPLDGENLSIFEAKKLCTLVGVSLKPVPSDLLFHQLTCLRALDLSSDKTYKGFYFEVLPSEVDMLLHLRYLDLSDTNLRELPETMRSLVNLQTLKLQGCHNICKLPEGIWELSNLIHREAERTSSLIYYPRGIERLS
ncbi:hypothetical protein IFM89_020093 [Coptis chinensis]|uniref:Uncharacterized protein n=1 Tax=Coptis chinensis TaxID=261450 RepID=A0A835HE19_9MAGN|nr:hypothetical protein IFM89_020093 [Coptis chinensis]